MSIIIPTYNRSRCLKRAIQSVFDQTYSNWEICIVDNYSIDGTIKLVNNFNDSRLRLYKIRNNGVIAASRNLGVRNANGKYIAFLDSDDWWKSRKLEVSVDALEQGADLVYHGMLKATKLNQNIFFRKVQARRLRKPIFNDLLIGGNALITSSVVMKKTIFIKTDGFQERQDLIAIEDYDFWLRVSRITENFEKIFTEYGYYWSGGGNTSNQKSTLTLLDVLENKYQNEILKLGIRQRMYWFSYSKARAFYFLGMKKKAIQSFNMALTQHPTLLVGFKCVIMLFIIRIQMALNKNQ